MDPRYDLYHKIDFAKTKAPPRVNIKKLYNTMLNIVSVYIFL